MSGKKQLGPAKQAAADKKKLNAMIKAIAEKPEETDFGTLTHEHRKRLHQIARQDLREMLHAFKDLLVNFEQDPVKKLMILKKGDEVLMEYAWDRTNLQSQLIVVRQLQAYYKENENKIRALDIPVLKIWREITEMVGHLPDEYAPGNEALEAYLDQYEEIEYRDFLDIVSFYKMKKALEEGTAPRVRHKKESKEDYTNFAKEYFKHFASMMYNDSVGLLRDRMDLRKRQAEDNTEP